MKQKLPQNKKIDLFQKTKIGKQRKMPQQISEIKDFLLKARRKDAKAVSIKVNKTGETKFKVRCSRYAKLKKKLLKLQSVSFVFLIFLKTCFIFTPWKSKTLTRPRNWSRPSHQDSPSRTSPAASKWKNSTQPKF